MVIKSMVSQNVDRPALEVTACSLASTTLSIEQREFVERLKRLYKVSHQAEYLYIQAEVDSLWIQLEQSRSLNNDAAV